MSGFCVYGVSLSDCRAKAEKKVSAYDSKGNRQLTADELRQRIEEMAQQMFENAGRVKQVSPAFDSPQFCRGWIDLAEKCGQIRLPKLMAKGVKPTLRKGQEVTGWVPCQS